MAYESHFVNGKLNYVHLADAEVDRYECAECGAIVKPKNVPVLRELPADAWTS